MFWTSLTKLHSYTSGHFANMEWFLYPPSNSLLNPQGFAFAFSAPLTLFLKKVTYNSQTENVIQTSISPFFALLFNKGNFSKLCSLWVSKTSSHHWHHCWWLQDKKTIFHLTSRVCLAYRTGDKGWGQWNSPQLGK